MRTQRIKWTEDKVLPPSTFYLLLSSFPFRWLPALAWMILIFIGSTDLLAASHTSRFVEPLLRWLFHGISDARVAELHHLIRKAGHVCEYAVLALLFCWALRPWAADRGGRILLLVLALTASYAASDEFHQVFIPSRGASPVDVLIDTCGATAALLLVFLWLRLRRPPASSSAIRA